MTDRLFTETQRSRFPLLVFGVAAVPIASYLSDHHFHPWDLLPLLFLPLGFLRLDVEVVPGVIRYRYLPIQLRWREVATSDVVGHAACRYDSGDYLGWGLRRSVLTAQGGAEDRCVTVSGEHGVRLTLSNGNRLL